MSSCLNGSVRGRLVVVKQANGQVILVLEVGNRKTLAFGVCIISGPSAYHSTSSMRRVWLRGNPDGEYNQCIQVIPSCC